MEVGGRRLERQLGQAGLQKTQPLLWVSRQRVFLLLLGGEEPRGLAGLHEPKHRLSCWSRKGEKKTHKGICQRGPGMPFLGCLWHQELGTLCPRTLSGGLCSRGEGQSLVCIADTNTAGIAACPAQPAPGSADGFPSSCRVWDGGRACSQQDSRAGAVTRLEVTALVALPCAVTAPGRVAQAVQGLNL